jgi:hypothetical protein
MLTWLLMTASAFAGESVRLSWDASASPEVVGYRIYYGQSSQSYPLVTNVGLVFTTTVVLPRNGRWFFAATSVDGDGFESDFSNEVVWDAKPAAPVLRCEPRVRLKPEILRSTNLVEWTPVVSEPTVVPAKQNAEFFILQGLAIERVAETEN